MFQDQYPGLVIIGDVIMRDKQVITGNTIKDGVFLVGNENKVENHINKIDTELEKLFSDLVKEINEKLTGNEKDEALHDAKGLEEAVRSGNVARAKKIYSILSDGVRTFASVIAIAKHYGWHI